MNKILFVCSGNVGRSQMAEGYYNNLTNSKKAMSAGIDLKTPSKYPHPVPEVIAVMKEEGIDVSSNIVKLVTKEMVDEAEKIIVMCNKINCPIFLQESKKAVFWSIEDPFKTSTDNFRKIRYQIKVKVLDLLK